jgi:hypothetical protein
MKWIFCLGLGLLLAGGAPAETIRTISWPDVESAGWPDGVTVEGDSLRVEHGREVPATVSLWSIDRPAITSAVWALEGEVACSGVSGKGYLELINRFPDGKTYFSRTLGDGAMTALSGDGLRRRFLLPFFNREGAPGPVRLEFNLLLPGPGRVDIGPCRLVQYASAAAAHRALGSVPEPGAWWGARQAGWIGGVGGSVLGLLGGLIGTLASLGRGRRFVTGATQVIILFGFLSAGAGLVALIGGQPYMVFYPLLLAGGVCVLVFGLNRKTILKRYQQIELRRMQSLDAA